MKRLLAVSTIKRWLTIGRSAERFELPEGAEAPVRQALICAVASNDAHPEIEGVLRLLVALESRLDSPSAAERLRSWMRATPEIHDVIRALGFGGVQGLDLGRAFKRREGRPVDLTAPRFGAVAPTGAVPLRRLLEQHPPPRRSRP